MVEKSAEHQMGVMEDRMLRYEKLKTEDQPEVGDYCLVTYPVRPPSKLSARFLGPYVIMAIDGSQADCQHLSTMKIKRFPITRLRRFRTGDDGEVRDDLADIAGRDVGEYKIEVLLDHKINKRTKEVKFLVKWAAEDDDTTWEDSEALMDSLFP